MRKTKNCESDNSPRRREVFYYGAILIAVKILVIAIFLSGCTEDRIDMSSPNDDLIAVGIEEIYPANMAESVEVNPAVAVIFQPGTDLSKVASSSIILKNDKGIVPGKVTVSGTTALFAYGADLAPMTEYTATIKTGGSKGDDHGDYSWKFRTGRDRGDNNLSVLSVKPANSAKDVPVSTSLIITVNKEVKSWMKAFTSVNLKAGSTSVAGTLSFSGKVITFDPTADLTSNTVYIGSFIYSAKTNSDGDDDDDEGDDDDKSGNTYSWSFTTIGAVTTGGTTDATPPSISGVTPANNATSVAAGSKVTATFSEAMNSTTINSSTFTLKQGGTAVAGSVNLSGNIATLTPSSALAAGLVYTASVTTGAKDAAGNALAAIYTWSFTTAAATVTDVTPPTVQSVTPALNATSVASGSKVSVTFSEAMNASTINATTFTLKQAGTGVAGTIGYSGNIATFTPSSALAAGTVYSGTVTTGAKDAAGNALASNYTWSFTTAAATVTDVTKPTVQSVTPASGASSVATGSKVTATFNEAMKATTISTTSFTLARGTTPVAGSVALSGNTATFTPTSALTAGTGYTATLTTTVADAAGNTLAANYSWSFTTAAAADVTKPQVQSVTPLASATSVATSSKVTATFNEAMKATSISTASFTLARGTTPVAGSVALSGNTATFTPSSALTAGTGYTATLTTTVADAAGNTLAANYSWSFTTAAAADVTKPTVQSVTPLANATGVAINSKVTVLFSEAMNSTSITSSTFTLNGGASVAGTVTYSGNTATFTPSANLAGSRVYTATVTTGVRDVAGNTLATTYTWSFTTVAVVTALSFANDVIPVLGLCNNCHTHPWTVSSNSSTYYTNLVNGGYVNPTSYTTSKIYTMLSGGHAGSISTTDKNKILNWMKEGSKNN